MALPETTRRRRRVVLPVLATVVVVGPVGFLWQASRLPASLGVLGMGDADLGSGVALSHAHSGPGTVSVPQLIADPNRPADVKIDLVARAAILTVGGRQVPGFSLNGTSPGPTITATQGQLVEVKAHNESVADGIALHWHGLDVPNAMDGVTGVTQDSIAVGEDFTYRFVADQVGSFWYHSHQVANAQVMGGLFGMLVVQPPKTDPRTLDVVVAAHTYGGQKTINGQVGDLRVPAEPGRRVRVRVVNTDNGAIQTWAAGPYRVLAIDGTDVNEPGEVVDRSVTATAGARVDLGITMPKDGTPVRVQVSSGTAVILGAGDPPPVPTQPPPALDLLTYGTPDDLGFDPTDADRRFDYSIGRRPGFVRGRPGLYWSINGKLYPRTPMFLVAQGDVVTMRIDNHSGDAHPMHLHGHHAVVLARNGVPATGSPWWVDSLDVQDKQVYDIAFVADNPGIWMDHCHNLEHASDGMTAHLMYSGVSTPYVIGGPRANVPE